MDDRAWVYTAHAATHTGSVRKLNEDAVLADDADGLWCVADGMGGHSAGDLASAEVVSALARVPAGGDLESVGARVAGVLAAVNGRLHAEAGRRATVIGTTVAVLIARGPQVRALWAGDSRAGRMRAGRLQWLTRDHSRVQELVDAGLLTPDAARSHPERNVITRAVGAQPELALDSAATEARPGDTFLLCSDGLVNAVPETEIARHLGLPDPERSAGALLAAALAHRARDNVSVVVIRVAPDPTEITRPIRPAG